MQQDIRTLSLSLKKETIGQMQVVSSTDERGYQLLTDSDNFIGTRISIDVDVADALAVTEHRDALGRPLDVLHQLGRPSGDNQVNHFVQPAQALHLLTSAHLEGKTSK